MPNYVANKNAQPTGEHEVHQTECHVLPHVTNQIDLGYHSSCSGAVSQARRMYPNNQFDGCKHCSPACHTR